MHNQNAQVLVVDDEWTIRQQLSRALELVGVHCECAANGIDALDRYLHQHHKLIVTDLRMPKINGHSLAVALLEQPDPPIVVALTGVTEPRLANDLLTRGVADVVYKPIDYFDLADQLSCLLESSELSQEREEGHGAQKQLALEAEPARAGEPLCLNRRDLEQMLMKCLPPHRWLTTALQWIDWEKVPSPPSEIRDAVRQLSGHPSHVPSDGRCEGRVILYERAVALALDGRFEPIGQPFKVIIRDLSHHGIGFVHTDQFTSEAIAISWRGLARNRLVVVTRIIRCRPIGAFFDIGAMIVHPSASLSDALPNHI
jgi:CheY-like chemotaxis protein